MPQFALGVFSFCGGEAENVVAGAGLLVVAGTEFQMEIEEGYAKRSEETLLVLVIEVILVAVLQTLAPANGSVMGRHSQDPSLAK